MVSGERGDVRHRNLTGAPRMGRRRADRFIVAEVEGYSIGGPDQWTPRLSVQVLDTAYCYGIVAEWNEEGMRWTGTQEERQAAMRARARGFAAILNARESKRLDSDSRAAIRSAIDATKRERLREAGTLHYANGIAGFREHGANGYRKGCKCETCRDGEAKRKRDRRRANPGMGAAESRAYRERKAARLRGESS